MKALFSANIASCDFKKHALFVHLLTDSVQDLSLSDTFFSPLLPHAKVPLKHMCYPDTDCE